MMKAMLLVLGIGIVSYLHLRKALSGQAIKSIKQDITVYLGIMLFTCVIGVLMIMGMKPLSPALPLEIVFEKIGKMILVQ